MAKEKNLGPGWSAGGGMATGRGPSGFGPRGGARGGGSTGSTRLPLPVTKTTAKSLGIKGPVTPKRVAQAKAPKPRSYNPDKEFDSWLRYGGIGKRSTLKGYREAGRGPTQIEVQQARNFRRDNNSGLRNDGWKSDVPDRSRAQQQRVDKMDTGRGVGGGPLRTGPKVKKTDLMDRVPKSVSTPRPKPPVKPKPGRQAGRYANKLRGME